MTARINTTNKSVDLFGSGKHGFKETSPPTEFSAEWCNNIQENQVRTVEQAGLTVTVDDYTQLYTAVALLSGAGIIDFTANTTLTSADANKTVIASGTTASTVLTLPTMSTMVDGGRFFVINHNTQTVSITRASTDVIRTIGGTTETSITLYPGASLFIVKGATAGQWEVFGGSYQNAVARQFAYFREEQTTDTNGSSVPGTAWTYQTQVLNTTIYNSITGCSLATNLVTLPAGTYYIIGRALINADARLQIYNSSDTSSIIKGPSSAFSAGGNPIAETIVTLTAQKNIALRGATVNTTTATWGLAANEGSNEVYGELFIERLY